MPPRGLITEPHADRWRGVEVQFTGLHGRRRAAPQHGLRVEDLEGAPAIGLLGHRKVAGFPGDPLRRHMKPRLSMRPSDVIHSSRDIRWVRVRYTMMVRGSGG